MVLRSDRKVVRGGSLGSPPSTIETVHVLTMQGIGDALYTRPFVRAWSETNPVWLETPWPGLYTDLDVRFVRPTSFLRCAGRNIDRYPDSMWSEPPAGAWKTAPGYGGTDLRVRGYTISGAIERGLPLQGREFVFDLPADLPPSPVSSDRPIAVVRPVTHRVEWPCPARNPMPEYVCRAAEILRDEGFHVVTVADIDPDHEPLVGGRPYADERYESGQLHIEQVLALIRAAGVVVAPVGWVVPACIAAKTPLVVIRGGAGAYNRPEILIDPRMGDAEVTWVGPPKVCMCKSNTHNCGRRKLIPDFDQQFSEALEPLAVAA